MYSYVAGNPINNIDPWGLKKFTQAETAALLEILGEQSLSEAATNHSGRGIYDYKGKIPGTYYASQINDVLGVPIDPSFQARIEDHSSHYNSIGNLILMDFTNNPLRLLAEFGFDNAARDLKTYPPFAPGKYSLVDGCIYKAEDLGNMIFGLYAEKSIYPRIISLLAGGAAQEAKEIKNNYFPNLFYIKYFLGDDPRGLSFVLRGMNQYNNWKDTGVLPR